MRSRLIISAVVVIGFGLVPQISRAGQTWQTARVLRVSDAPTVTYGQLQAEGQAYFFRLTIAQPTTLRFAIGQPTGVKQFSPRVVIFQPDVVTAGPALPIEQPPHTVAMIYPPNRSDASFEIFTQISYTQTLEQVIALPVAGQYYLAIYNASAFPGRYRLVIDRGQGNTASWADAWRLPERWWQDQAFAGWSWRTLISPVLLIVLAILVIEQLRFYHLHHLATPMPPKKKVSPRRKKKPTSP